MKQSKPFFSIVIPTYGRPQQLAICLDSLAHLDYPHDRFEVIVVDDGSENPPDAVVASFDDRLAITLLRQPHTGPATARNAGAAQAKGSFLALTDDDCRPAPHWLSALAARFAVAPDCAIGGYTLNALPRNIYATASQMLVDYLYVYYNADPNQACFFASNNLALPTDRFWAAGGFDTIFPRAAAEDRDLCDRWLHHGYRLLYAPEALVYHSHALGFRTFLQQHFNYGRGAFHFHQARAQRGQCPVRLEPLKFYLGLLRSPLSQTPYWPGVLLTALMGLSQIANMAGFFWESVSHPEGRSRSRLTASHFL